MNPSGVSGAWLAGFLSRSFSNGLVFTSMMRKYIPARCCLILFQDSMQPEETRMSAYELAQLNIGVIKGPIDSPVMADFVANLDQINALAERSPGFVWRLQTEEGNATAIRPFENENIAVNMSVWRDVESLSKYVYSSAHVEIM